MVDARIGRYGRLAVAGAVVLLAVLSAASGSARLGTQGAAAAGDVVVSLYIAALVVWGVVAEGFRTDRFRVLVSLGLVLWGVVDVAVGAATARSVALLVIGTALLARVGYRRIAGDG
ncbi:hypothetical protein [Halorubrum sp. BV1]|uniref:hypothetical protein n=1 Tax=Halorubrum sp. BV1 TaxID=1498500 RepID=UPI0006791E79|nr:hypothetical protein [Halorubrum sp. BV1]